MVCSRSQWATAQISRSPPTVHSHAVPKPPTSPPAHLPRPPELFTYPGSVPSLLWVYRDVIPPWCFRTCHLHHSLAPLDTMLDTPWVMALWAGRVIGGHLSQASCSNSHISVHQCSWSSCEKGSYHVDDSYYFSPGPWTIPYINVTSPSTQIWLRCLLSIYQECRCLVEWDSSSRSSIYSQCDLGLGIWPKNAS